MVQNITFFFSKQNIQQPFLLIDVRMNSNGTDPNMSVYRPSPKRVPGGGATTNKPTGRPHYNFKKGTGMNGQKRKSFVPQQRVPTQNGPMETHQLSNLSPPLSSYPQGTSSSSSSENSENSRNVFYPDESYYNFLRISLLDQKKSASTQFSRGIAKQLIDRAHELCWDITGRYERDMDDSMDKFIGPQFLFEMIGLVYAAIHNFPFTEVVALKELSMAQDEDALMAEPIIRYRLLKDQLIDVLVSLPSCFRKYFDFGYKTSVDIEGTEMLTPGQLGIRHSMLRTFRDEFNEDAGIFGIRLVFAKKVMWPSKKLSRSAEKAKEQ